MSIGQAIGSAAGAVNQGVADPAKEKIKELQEFLPHRPEIKDEKPTFVKGVELSTPDGYDPTVPAVGSPTAGPSSNVELGLQIEFIHFGRVHHDVSDYFVGSEAVDDTKKLKSEEKVGGRGLYFRAALQREAVFLGGLAKSISSAMEEMDAAASGIGDLVTMAADILGGQGGTSSEPSPADMMQFLDKVAKAYNQINKEDITYTDLHDAGIQLHTVRATLLKYLHDRIPKKEEEDPNAPAPPSTPDPTGMLSNLPFGASGIPIPGPIGDVITFMRTVTGKIFDVQMIMIYGLALAMREPIEKACRDITIDFLNDERTPIYPIWSLPIDPATSSGPFANMAMNDPITGPLAGTEYGSAANSAVQSGVGGANSALNSAAAAPMEVVDFLSKPYPSPPGGKYLDGAFQVEAEIGIFGGSEKLAELAVAAFYTGISTDPPEFLQGFVADFLSYIFAVDLEFLRGVYRTLCSMPTNETVNTAELVAAGSVHLVGHFIDLATSKLGLDEMIKGLEMPIPANPVPMQGINWPTGTLSAEPIAAELKKMLAEKIGPYISPVVEYAMNGLAAHLNATRGWAKGGSFTMEAHLADLPYALALLFRNTFGPLWSFITDILYGIVGSVLKDALGPYAEGLGFAGDALTSADSYISQAQNWASEAGAYATNVEQKAGAVMSALSGVGTTAGAYGIPTGVTGLDTLQSAAGALTSAAGANPFSALVDPLAPTPGELFPKDRVVTGKGIDIEQSEYDEVSANHQYDEAKEEGANADDPNASPDPNAPPDPNASGGTGATGASSGATPP